jgi:hypothetical protein
MSRWSRIALAAVLAVGLVAAAAGCGGSSPLSSIDEGEGFDLGGLRWNVLYDRFLNPAQVEDAAYLTGQPTAGPDQVYFGEFVLVKNDGSDPKPLPDRNDFRITDTTITDVTRGYEPVESSSLFSFPFGGTIAGDSTVPDPDSVAAQGPTQGVMLLFLLNRGVTENRPLELHICSDNSTSDTCQGEEATIKLDL